MTEATRNFVIPEGRATNAAGEIKFIRARDLTVGPILEGTFLGAIPNQFDEDKNDFKFETEAGIVILNGAGNLGYKMGFISAGDYVQVTYEGQGKMSKGKYAGKLVHNFEVLVAE
jgi:hypothetical protein